MKAKSFLSVVGSIAAVVLIIVLGLNYVKSAKKEVPLYSAVIEQFESGKVAMFKLDLNGQDLEYWVWDQMETTADGKVKPKEKAESVKYRVPNVNLFWDQIRPIFEAYNASYPDAKIQYDLIEDSTGSWLLEILPTLLMGAIVAGFAIYMMRRMTQTMTSENNKSMSFSKARLRQNDKDKSKTTFDDVAGADEEKEELREIVEFLRDPQHFSELGARIPKGVLLVGPPGTGKTLLARAVAGEADVPFFAISGSDFVELYVGVGASRVRDMFTQAKKHAPSIVFIDEIDAVGRQRGAGMGGGHDEREQTLNQLLVEMDGFGPNEGVIIIAATNRPDILDPALLRPGRFDRQVTVMQPDVRGREAILRVHARNKPLAPDVDLKIIAQTTVGFTGADLENLLNEAALLAARTQKKAITHTEIEAAMLKVVVGTEKKSHKKTEKDLRLTAYHEAGHAVAAYYLESQDPVHQISVISRGMAAGFTMHLPTEDHESISKTDMEEDIVTLLGGRVAEALVLHDISTGASNDIERATKLAHDMVVRYGMSAELGPISYASDHGEVFLGRDYTQTRSYSEYMAEHIDIAVKKIIDTAYTRTEDILNAHMDQLTIVAEALRERETLSGEAFRQLMAASDGEDEPEENQKNES